MPRSDRVTFPTGVGMNRGKSTAQRFYQDVPHRRGDEPAEMDVIQGVIETFPTGVGMNRLFIAGKSSCDDVPHRRGDEPSWMSSIAVAIVRSPQAWG